MPRLFTFPCKNVTRLCTGNKLLSWQRGRSADVARRAEFPRWWATHRWPEFRARGFDMRLINPPASIAVLKARHDFFEPGVASLGASRMDESATA